MNRRAMLATALAFAALPGPLRAQGAYPVRPVKIIVPVTTGGPSDLVARILGDKLAASLGKPVVIENRPGASMVVGSAAVAKSEPDGYTLLQAAANMAINPILMSDLPYDTAKDFAPVSLTHLTPYVFVVSGKSLLGSLAELIKHARENPGRVTYATTGPGSPQLLATLLLAQQAGLSQMTEVQYKGSSAAHPDLIADRITFMIDPLAASSPHVKSGALRALAVTTPQRNASFPNVPTASEAGVPGYDFASWGGLFAPAGTPREIVLRLNAEVGKALASPDLIKRFEDLGLVAKASTPEAFGAFLFSEMARWKAVLGARKPQ
ncbi:MAG TPA: tripartite tricarboxylate transporter substrate binding protein [Burkholderiales bacterium]|nr:tripartite tricarboxylate transporter substrate binding protein [Burkholderiales bacterium]